MSNDVFMPQVWPQELSVADVVGDLDEKNVSYSDSDECSDEESN
jgi:hypothetical protein